MPNADRECNSPRAIRCAADNPISLTKGSESVRNNAETGFAGPLGPEPGTQGRATQRNAGRFERFSSERPNISRQFAPPRPIAIKAPLACLDGASTLPAGSAPGRRLPIEFYGQAAI
jgi:hypothetical protein